MTMGHPSATVANSLGRFWNCVKFVQVMPSLTSQAARYILYIYICGSVCLCACVMLRKLRSCVFLFIMRHLRTARSVGLRVSACKRLWCVFLSRFDRVRASLVQTHTAILTPPVRACLGGLGANRDGSTHFVQHRREGRLSGLLPHQVSWPHPRQCGHAGNLYVDKWV